MTDDNLKMDRFQRMQAYLLQDPTNLRLLADAAAAAYEVGQVSAAEDCLQRYEQTEVLPAGLLNLRGLIAISEARFSEAIELFSALEKEAGSNPILRFNKAWCHAMLDSHEEALAGLDEEVLSVSPRAPALKIQMLHHLQRYDEALATGETLGRQYPGDTALFGALATLAMDAEQPDLAIAYAGKAGNHPEGLTTQGLFKLHEGESQAAADLFSDALRDQSSNPRAWLGLGLARLTGGKAIEGAEAIERGAELFQDHLGSWIAAGWARYIAGDTNQARAHFSRALALDDSFSEAHGALAVLDLADGSVDSAKKHAEIARRLDRNSLGGSLAQILLLQMEGRPEMAQKVREAALSAQIGPNGETIAQALARYGTGVA